MISNLDLKKTQAFVGCRNDRTAIVAHHPLIGVYFVVLISHEGGQDALHPVKVLMRLTDAVQTANKFLDCGEAHNVDEV